MRRGLIKCVGDDEVISRRGVLCVVTRTVILTALGLDVDYEEKAVHTSVHKRPQSKKTSESLTTRLKSAL